MQKKAIVMHLVWAQYLYYTFILSLNQSVSCCRSWDYRKQLLCFCKPSLLLKYLIKFKLLMSRFIFQTLTYYTFDPHAFLCTANVEKD